MALRIYRRFNLFDLIEIAGACAGFIGGLKPFLKRGHWLPGIFIGIALGLVFYIVARIPRIIADALVTRWIRRKQTDQLKAMLVDNYPIATYVILELIRRNEDVSFVKERLFHLLESDCSETRKYGWNNLCVFYPNTASQIDDYDPFSSLEHCKMVLDRLKNT
jgi:hypothetical protein